MGVLTIADTLALEHLCEACADSMEAPASLGRDVIVPDGQRGSSVIARRDDITYRTECQGGWMIRQRPEMAAIA